MRLPKGRESTDPGQMQLENRSTVLRLLRIVGATFRRGVLRCAVADFGGRFLEKREIPLALDQPVEDVLRTLCAAVSDLINRFSSRGTIVGVGVSVPGPIDLEKGEIPRLTNLPGWNPIPILFSASTKRV